MSGGECMGVVSDIRWGVASGGKCMHGVMSDGRW